jgi:hypothetical protein
MDYHQRLIKPRRESVHFDELEKLLEESFAPAKTSARRALRSPRMTGLAPGGTTATTAAAIEGDAPTFRKVVGSREVLDRMLDDLLSAAVPTAPFMVEEATSPGETASAAAAAGPPATTLPAPPAQTPGAATLFVFFVVVLLWWVNCWV